MKRARMFWIALSIFFLAPAGIVIAFFDHAGPTPQIVCTIPVGGETGIHYGNVDIPESLPYGPSSFTVTPDGDFVIADTIKKRLLLYNYEGEFKGIISLSQDISNIADLIATDHFWVLDFSFPAPNIRQYEKDGKELEVYALPSSVSVELSGISSGDEGQILIELRNGTTKLPLTDIINHTEIKAEQLQGFVTQGKRYNTRWNGLCASGDLRKKGSIIAGDKRIEISTEHGLGGLYLLYVNRDGSFYVIVEEVAQDKKGTIIVDQTIRHYKEDGELVGMARAPLSSQFINVEHAIKVNPVDGAVYYLLAQRDNIQIQRLFFSKTLKSILLDSDIEQETELQNGSVEESMTDNCLSFETDMKPIINQFLTCKTKLTSVNVSGECEGRQIPPGVKVGIYNSVPYDWGGFDTCAQFQKLMHKGNQAGDNSSAPEKKLFECSRGVDCSGFVARVWKREGKLDTTGLETISRKLDLKSECLSGGDIFLRPGYHVIMFEDINPYMQSPTIVESAGGLVGRVVEHPTAWADLNAYTPRRYNKACGQFPFGWSWDVVSHTVVCDGSVWEEDPITNCTEKPYHEKDKFPKCLSLTATPPGVKPFKISGMGCGTDGQKYLFEIDKFTWGMHRSSVSFSGRIGEANNSGFCGLADKSLNGKGQCSKTGPSMSLSVSFPWCGWSSPPPTCPWEVQCRGKVNLRPTPTNLPVCIPSQDCFRQ